MTFHGVSWKRLAMAFSVAALATALLVPDLVAQRVGVNPNVPDLSQGPGPLPPTPPRGAWGEVVMANDRWMVVQNHQGQQFPIASNAITRFLIRWPTTLAALTNQSVVEAIGPDLGSNVLRTDHVDVFEGNDRDLVSPTYSSLLPNNRVVTTIDPGFNRMMNAFDIGSQNLLYGWAYPVAPGQSGIPTRLHVVGPVFETNPLRIAIPGNNFATVVADQEGMTLTQLTRGTTAFAEKGDLVFLMPTSMTSRTVVLSQLVLYKRIPLSQFRPR